MFIAHSLLHAVGRHGRIAFIIALLVFTAIYIPQHFIVTPILGNVWGFLLSLFFFTLNCYMLYCLFARRLHDMGRSVWAFMAMITLELGVIITTMMAFGGAEYFSAFAVYDRKDEIPQEVRDEIISTYQTTLEAHHTQTVIIFWIVPVLFCLWLAIAKGDAGENKYGPAPAPVSGAITAK